MRLKYLFGSLLGGALLAACTADDALDANLTAQEANPYAPVFTVSMDDKDALGTRVEAITAAGKLSFEEGDLLTLFHGEGDFKNLTGTKNAIYKAEGGNAENQLVFKTQSMIDKGYAVMVWPSDTTFASLDDNGVYVKISLDQKYKNEGSNHKRWQENGSANFHQLEEDTWLGTPYISEILDIQGWDDYEKTGTHNQTTTAGYGRNYDIKLKQIGSTMRLKVIRENEEDLTQIVRADGRNAKGITFKSVKIETDGENVNPFTSKIKVIGKDKYPTGHTTTGPRSIWAKVSEVDVENIKTGDASNEIATNHIVNAGYSAEDNTSTAYFTLLPTNVTAAQNEADATEIPEPAYTKAKVTIETYYGTVEVEGTVAGKNSKDEEYAQVTENNKDQLKWYKNYGKETEENYSVRGGLNEFLTGMYSDINAGTDFVEEKIGHSSERQLVVDMTKIKMNGKLHIVNEDQLLDVMAVYTTITKNSGESTIALYLDGDKNNEFVMHQDTWEQVVKEMKDKRLQFIPCQKTGEKCDYIKLIADEDSEVPVLNFGKDSEHTSTTKAVTVRLAGGKNWTYKNTQNLAGIDVLEVVDGTKLELKGEAKVGAAYSVAPESNFAINNKGEVNVKSAVRVGVNVVNNGELNITTNSELIMNNGKVFTNESGKPTNDDDEVLLECGGLVYNDGWFGIEDKSDATINNYGTIKAISEKARTYISTNSLNTDGEKALGVGYDAKTNKIGTIILHEKTGGDNNTRVSDQERQGFIKLEVDAENVTADDYGTVANYIVLNEGVKTYTDAETVKYVEVNVSKNKEVKFINETGEDGELIPTKLDGLIVNPDRKVNIPEGVTVTVAVRTYLHGGRITKAGTFTPGGATGETETSNPNYVSYFGGTTSDYKNVVVY